MTSRFDNRSDTPPPEIDLSDSLLYFVHIPKTAGTSIYSFLDRHFLPNQVFPADLAAWHQEGMAKMPPESIDRFSCVRGHLYHRQLGRFFAASQKRIVPITILRRPLSQLLSEYDMVVNDPNGPFHDEALDAGLTFEEFLHRPRYFAHYADNPDTQGLHSFNRQAAHLLLQREENPYQLPPSAWWDESTRMLSDYPVIGLSERFDDTLQLLAFTFGWRCPMQGPRLNPMRGERSTVSDEVATKVQKLNAVDFQLYDWASNRFDSQYRAMVEVLVRDEGCRPDDPDDGISHAINRRSDRRLARRMETTSNNQHFELLESSGLHLGHVSPSALRQINWIGPNPHASFTVAVPGSSDRILRLEFVHWLTTAMLDDLQITVNSHAIPWARSIEGPVANYVAYLPAAIFRSRPLTAEIVLSTSAVSTPAAEGINPADHEQKCLGLASLELIGVEVPALGPTTWTAY
jgi:hypothetical protein